MAAPHWKSVGLGCSTKMSTSLRQPRSHWSADDHVTITLSLIGRCSHCSPKTQPWRSEIAPRAEQVEEEEEKEGRWGGGASPGAKYFAGFQLKTTIGWSSSRHQLLSWQENICPSKTYKSGRMPWCNNWQIFDLILVLGTISLSGNGLQAAFLDAVRTGRRPELSRT